jgi:hypothetical protein
MHRGAFGVGVGIGVDSDFPLRMFDPDTDTDPDEEGGFKPTRCKATMRKGERKQYCP